MAAQGGAAAAAASRARIGSISQPQQPAFNPGQGQRSRSGGRQTPPNPAFHKDHPWVKAQKKQNQVPASGNGQGQSSGAASVQTSRPQPVNQVANTGASGTGPFTSPRMVITSPRLRPLPPTPSSEQSQRTYSQVASEEARRTVGASISQQVSVGAQIAALSETRWRQEMERALGMSTSASSRPSSAGSQARTPGGPGAPSQGQPGQGRN